MDLERDFGLTVTTLEPHPGGFATDGWVADGRWFVKVWQKGESPAGLELLTELRSLGLPVVEPIKTVSGGLFAMDEGRACAVFPYMTGRTATQDGDWRATARAVRQVHAAPPHVSLPIGTTDEPAIWPLAERLDHPWIADRRQTIVTAMERLHRVIARLQPVRQVICHTDLHGFNLLVDDHGDVAAILDWENAVIGPREHDVWIGAENPHLQEFLDEYGARDLDLDHLEYALLARGLRDLAARVLNEVDRPGVDSWGFGRIVRLDSDLEAFRPYCRTSSR